VAHIGERVAGALAYAHGQGVVHRDIKPSNLLLDNRGTVWVTDFGLAKADDGGNLTQTGDILGTLRYMPPEAFGGKVDARGDIYALGLTLYELLTFRPAFEEKDRGRLIRQVTDEAPPPVWKLNPDVPRDLATVVQKAIDRDPAHRYASASELADDLRRFVDDEPIRARRASPAERLARWCRRNPAVAMLSGAVALLVLAAIGGLLYGYRTSLRALRVETDLRAVADHRARQAEEAGLLAARHEAEARESAQRERQARQDATAALGQAEAAGGALEQELYISNVRLAQAALDARDGGQAAEALDRARPGPARPDHRGFEWHHFRRQLHGERRVWEIPGYSNVGGLQTKVSPDGRLVLSLGTDGSNRYLAVREVATGRELGRLPAFGTLASGYRIAWSRDGARLAVAGHTGRSTEQPGVVPAGRGTVELRVWNLADGRECLRLEKATSADAVISLGLDAGGTQVAVGLSRSIREELDPSRPGVELAVHDVATGGKPRWEASLPFDERISLDALAFDALGRTVTVGSIVRSPDASIFLGAGRLRAYETESGRMRFDIDLGADIPNSVQLDSEGRRIATALRAAGVEATVQLRDAQTGAVLASQSLPFLGTASFIRFSPDDRFLLAWAPLNPALLVLDAASGLAPVLQQRLDAVPDSSASPITFNTLLSDALFLPGGRGLRTLSGGVVKDWDFSDRDALARHRVFRDVVDLSVTPDGATVAVLGRQRGTHERSLTLFDRAAGTPAEPLPVWFPPAGSNHHIRLASDGRHVVLIEQAELGSGNTGSRPGRMELWELPSGRRVPLPEPADLGGVPDPSRQPAFSPDGSRLALVVEPARPSAGTAAVPSVDHFVAILDAASGRLIQTLRTTAPDLPPIGSGLTFSPDGMRMACTAQLVRTSRVPAKGAVLIWDLASGRLLTVLRRGASAITLPTFSFDGRSLAGYQATSRRVFVWRLDEPDQPLELATPLRIQQLAFHPDSRRLAGGSTSRSGSLEGKIQLWDVASGRELVSWTLPAPVATLSFTPDGHRLVAATQTFGGDSAQLVDFDAAPLDPEIEGLELVQKLRVDRPLNDEVVAAIRLATGYDTAVIAAAERLARGRPEDLRAITSRAASYLGRQPGASSAEDAQAALSYTDGAIRLDPSDGYAHELRGVALYHLGQFEPARDEQRRAIELGPPRAAALAYLAMCEAKLGRRVEAEAALEQARAVLAKLDSPSAPPPAQTAQLVDVAEAVVHGTQDAGKPPER
jgi:WD40 repeat protein